MQVTLSAGVPDDTSRLDRAPKASAKNEEFSSSEPIADPQRLQDLQKDLAVYNVDLKFTRDVETGRLVVEMIDQKTGDSLRQTPTEVTLRLTRTLGRVQGQLINKQV